MNLFKYSIVLSLTMLLGCKDNNNKTSIQSISPLDRNKSIRINRVDELNFDNEQARKIKIPADVLEERQIKVEELFSNIEFTPLETTDKSIIGSINKIICDSNFYFIHDKRNNKVLRFNNEGKFLNSIGSIGKGPMEVANIGDVAINRDKKFVSILDYKLKKIVKYTYSGKYLFSEPLFYVVSQHEYADNEAMVFSVTRAQRNTDIPAIDSYGLLLADKESVPFAVAFKNPKKSFSNKTINPLRSFGGKIYYHHPFSDGIWQIEDSIIRPILKFEFEKNGLSPEVWKESINNKEFNKLLDKNILFSGDYVILNDLWFLQVYTNNQPVGALFYNYNTGALKYGVGLRYSKEIPLSFLVGYPNGITDDGFFISIREAMDLHSIKKIFLKNKKIKETLRRKDWDKLNKIKPTDNPVIVTYKLKDF
ncbi:6-bladed beta-propeller [Snuella lapsa]